MALNKFMDATFVSRQSALDAVYVSLPEYASPGFWQRVECGNLDLEVIVRLLRFSIQLHDKLTEERLLSMIFQSISEPNSHWAHSCIRRCIPANVDAHYFVHDLISDLHETMYRSLIQDQHDFWEIHFFHYLKFLRTRVTRQFMVREGWWSKKGIRQSERIPRPLLYSLSFLHSQEDFFTFELEDEQAYASLLTVEISDLVNFVYLLPERLYSVLLLAYWHDKSISEIALHLRISDRAVRSRLQQAHHLLRETLISTRAEFL